MTWAWSPTNSTCAHTVHIFVHVLKFIHFYNYTFIVAVYEQDSEPAIIADKMTRLLSEAEPPLKATQDQEVTTELPCVAFKQLNVYFKHLF